MFGIIIFCKMYDSFTIPRFGKSNSFGGRKARILLMKYIIILAERHTF